MGKYFGTDGFRGEANKDLSFEHAVKIGRFLGWYYGAKQGKKAKIVIGKDTRRSSYMFEYALCTGLMASGADAYIMHVTTTPSVAYITRVDDFDCGIMISASHNPYYDNGIKLLNGNGEKMDEETILLVEDYIDGKVDVPIAERNEIGRTVDYASGRNRYIGYLISMSKYSFKDVKVGPDVANGAAWQIAKGVFEALGAKTYVMNDAPDGYNINTDCGSTHIEHLQKFVVENGLDVGFAFDGDADRCLLVDETGEVIDGDHIMGILADFMKRNGKLKGGAVGTILTNLGLHAFLEEKNIPILSTKVGDRYVLECMRAEGWNIGGEQSGHLILSDYATTGDGQLTAVQFLCAMKMIGKPASELNRMIESFPQISINVAAPNAVKHQVAQLPEVVQVGEEIKAAFNGAGRVVIRPSGTEPKVRVMVEGRDKAMVEELAKKAAEVVKIAVEKL